MTTENIIPSDAEHELNQEIARMARTIFHSATPPHSNKMRGVGITRKMKSKSKKNLRIEKNSRRRNRK
jgi:hypothetical protein